MHGAQDILLGGLTHRVLLIIGQDNHVLPRVAEVTVEICGHVFDVVDAASKLAPLTKIVDADQEGFAPPCAIGVLEAVALRGTVAESLHGLRRWRWGVVVSLDVGVGIDGRKACYMLKLIRHKESNSCPHLDVLRIVGLHLAEVVRSRN